VDSNCRLASPEFVPIATDPRTAITAVVRVSTKSLFFYAAVECSRKRVLEKPSEKRRKFADYTSMIERKKK
jgi:hypothetical protein